jgi:hypothetical protein
LDKKTIIMGCLGVLLLGTTTASLLLWRSESNRNQELEEQLKVLREQEKRSAVDRSISKQMENIAIDQQTISEKRREEALQQTLLAQEMTRRSEMERQNALKAQAIAEKSEKEAREAYLMAENQRQIADQQRLQAEFSKRVADTLNYVSLSRSLGTQAYTQYQAGDTVIGTMLAYSSYLFNQDYKGDPYTPAIFQALALTSKGQQTWNMHEGTISRVEWEAETNRLISASTYGEIFTHERQNGQLVSHCLFKDNNYDFRDAFACYTNGAIYAVSRTGHLLIFRSGKTDILTLDDVPKPFKLSNMNDGKQLLIVGEKSIAQLDISTGKIIGTRQLDFQITSVGRIDYKPLLFDDKGRMHVVNSLDDMETTSVPVPGKITAFASSKNQHLSAFGTADGTIYLIDGKENVHQLISHRSKVTKLKFNGNRLYSSSYDGQLLLWVIGDSQIRPVTLFNSNSWILDFTFDSQKDYIWLGDANGNLTEFLMSMKLIQERIRKNLVRDFTQDEWDYFIGKSIPFRSFIDN